MASSSSRSAVRRGASAVRGTSAGRALARTVNDSRLRRALPGTRLFDRDYYEAQRGRTFSSEREAMLDFLIEARTTPYSPNPLFDVGWYAGEPVRNTVKYLITYLRDGAGHRGTGPLFDAERYLADQPAAADHPGGPLGHFLSRAKDDTPLPVPRGFSTVPAWGETRTHLIDVAHRETAASAAAQSRNSYSDVSAVTVSLVSTSGPLVSVVMPALQDRALVTAAVASVTGQTYRDWELVLVDDGSGDAVSTTIASLSASDPRIRLVTARGPGEASARNTGTEAARGEWVAYVDPDRELTSDHLARMVEHLGTTGAAAAVCATNHTTAVGSIVVDTVPSVAELTGGTDLDLAAFVLRRDLVVSLGGFDESLPTWSPLDLVLRLTSATEVARLAYVGMRRSLAAKDAEDPVDDDEGHSMWVVLGRAVMSWDAVRSGLDSRTAGRVSISMPTWNDSAMTVRAVSAVLASSDGHDVEVVVVDNGSDRSVSAIITSAFRDDDRVRLVRLPRNLNFAVGSNVGMAESTGEYVVMLNNDTEVQPGWLDGLVTRLSDPTVRGTQPLLVYPDGTIQSAGSFLPGGDVPAVAILAGYPPQDATRVELIRTRVVTAAALAVRAHEFAELEGFDPIFVNGQEDVDYCLRAVERHGGGFEVVTSSVVIHHESKTPERAARIPSNRRLLVKRWNGRLTAGDPQTIERLGLRIAHWDPAPHTEDLDDVLIPSPVYVRDARTVESGPAAGLPSLRWCIKIAAHPGPRGDGWGDVHFAAALTRALETLGQQVVIDRRESHYRPTGGLDDVVLVIRGLVEVIASVGRTNLLWIISHPDLVTDRELRSYNRVFAASDSWSARMTAAGSPVTALLQATEPGRFHPGLAEGSLHTSALFVGRSRNVLRPIVRDAVEAGIDFALYGDGWEQFGLGPRVVAQYFPYDTVGAAYASAGVVLNDHWSDMAREGFLSNRLFDAVASGARVVTDEITGLDGLFSGAVQVYHSPAELALLCSPEGRGRFPTDGELTIIAAQVAERHSFEHRARSLLDAAIAARSEQGW